MSSCRHTAPPRATFLQVGERGEATRTLSSFRCHPWAPFCAITTRASASTILFSIFILFEKKMRKKKESQKITNNAAPGRDYRHQKMNALLGPSAGTFFSCYIRDLSFPLEGCSGRGFPPNPPTSLFAFQLRKCFVTITFIKIYGNKHIIACINY